MIPYKGYNIRYQENDKTRGGAIVRPEVAMAPQIIRLQLIIVHFINLVKDLWLHQAPSKEIINKKNLFN